MFVATEIEINIRLKKTSVLWKYCRASWVLKCPSHLNLYGRCPHERATEATERVATDYPVWCYVTFHYTLGQSLTLIYRRFSCYVLVYRKSFGINETFFFITSKSLHVSLFHGRVLTAYFVSNLKGTVCKFMSSSAHILDYPAALIRSPSFSQACRVTTLVFAHQKGSICQQACQTFLRIPINAPVQKPICLRRARQPVLQCLDAGSIWWPAPSLGSHSCHHLALAVRVQGPGRPVLALATSMSASTIILFSQYRINNPHAQEHSTALQWR